MKIIRATDKKQLALYFKRLISANSRVEAVVKSIIHDVAKNGDKALFKYNYRFDGFKSDKNNLKVTKAELQTATKCVEKEVIDAILIAKANICKFHSKQLKQKYEISVNGALTGIRYLPVSSAGLYVPGGKAVYPSTVLMNVLPAKIAGVKRIVICTPAGKDGTINPVVLAAAKICGVEEIYKTGGAQAVAAMAYGTKLIPKVDKITGPGNIFVATAKKLVFGQVGIDNISGPSEVLIIADKYADPEVTAADILSQAEHDEDATCILVTDSKKLAADTLAAISRQVKSLPKREIADAALKRGCAVLVENMNEAAQISNTFAPEHLQIISRHDRQIFNLINNAGAVFLGKYSPVALGDYIAGTNHVLPTSGTARFSSGLGVEDFIKRISYVKYSKSALKDIYPSLRSLAGAEKLEAHNKSVSIRL
ncbi:MAG: histidinol dehydrogenase [Candidatus Firestonebacteria bacterium]